MIKGKPRGTNTAPAIRARRLAAARRRFAAWRAEMEAWGCAVTIPSELNPPEKVGQ